MSKTYSISELANEFDVTPRAIRHYEDENLLNPERVGRNRIYSERDRVRLKLILRGKRVGFALQEIKEILDLYDTPHGETAQLQYLQDKIQERRSKLHQQQQDIAHMLDELNQIETRIT